MDLPPSGRSAKPSAPSGDFELPQTTILQRACLENGDRFGVGLSDYPYAEADEVATRRTGSSLRRLSWAIHASASASDSKPSIVWRAPSLPAMLMLKPVPSALGTIAYVVMGFIWDTRIRIASRTGLVHQNVRRWMVSTQSKRDGIKGIDGQAGGSWQTASMLWPSGSRTKAP